jgi:uncharacterized caspase-like protein
MLNAPMSSNPEGGKAMRPARTFSSIFLCLLLMTALPGWVSSAAAQQQEKRIALVVGNGAYTKGALATTANDAGLIAQNLQAAGFDVIGARDLNADTLRKSFHDFMQKAESAGQNTVALIYLAGYGVQLAGENYFIPVDTDISRDSDIPTEGIRISDYTHQLASLPLKASIVVLDAARQQPFIEGNSQIASGLALVDPENNMLIAYNAAPGTVAPPEPGPYGIYAQSLAEMIRTGGLALPDVFDRLRMRVNETTKGAQVPWDAQKIQAQFFFFDRAPDAPAAQGPADQVAAIRTGPIRSMSAQDAYAAAIARDTLQGYDDFVLGFPNDPMAPRVRAIIAARREAITWRRTYLTDTPPGYWSYLRRYPDGPHSWDARRRLTYLSAALDPPPSFAMIDYDVPPPPPAEFAIIDRPVVYFGDPDFGFAPPPPPPVFFLPPPPPDFVVLPPPFPVVGLFVLPQPRFVAMPAFVVAPAYVAPPPNNIVFNNIHNTTVINNVINVQPPAVAAGSPAAAAAAAAGTAPVGATTPVPSVVRTQALAIQKNPTQALPPSQRAFVANPTAKAGTAVATPVNTTTTAPAALPQRNALPGATGGQQLPQGKGVTAPVTTAPSTATTTPAVTPNTRLAPTTQQPAGVNQQQRGASPTTTTPTKPPVAQTQPTPATTPSPSPSPSTAAKPTPRLEKPLTPAAQPNAVAKPEPKLQQRQVTSPPPAPKPAAAPRPSAPAPRPQAAAPKPPPPPPPPKPQAAPRPPPPAPHPAAAPRPAAPAKKCKPGEKC